MANPASFFSAAAGLPPLPFQLSWMQLPPAPVGTLTTLVGWLWRRQQQQENTPRRLIYQLPLRALTECEIKGQGLSTLQLN